MANILHLDSSPRGERSHSRTLTQEFISAWKAAYPDDAIAYRDIGRDPIPHVTETWIAASVTSPEQRTPELAAAIQLSDELIDEFLAADRYVFGIPMFNFGIPSVFKAYIDQIVRARRTFEVTPNGYEGLVKGKKMLVITARGGSYPAGTPMEGFDLQAPYIRAAFGLMGVTDITFIHADNLAMGDEARQQSLTNARTAIENAIATW
jgi:FMN-dependent NADH-azoreductase